MEGGHRVGDLKNSETLKNNAKHSEGPLDRLLENLVEDPDFCFLPSKVTPLRHFRG
jgi:hypothetical protein